MTKLRKRSDENPTLKKLVEDFKKAHKNFIAALVQVAYRVTKEAAHIGEILLAMQKEGNFKTKRRLWTWLENEVGCGIPRVTFYRYVNAAEWWKQAEIVSGKEALTDVASLKALKLLASPKVEFDPIDDGWTKKGSNYTRTIQGVHAEVRCEEGKKPYVWINGKCHCATGGLREAITIAEETVARLALVPPHSNGAAQVLKHPAALEAEEAVIEGGDPDDDPNEKTKEQTYPQTPLETAKKIIGMFSWQDGETVLEPCRGEGAFYNQLPACVQKDWCEITEGKDFFNYSGKPDTVITNPPYNLLIEFLEKAMQVAQKRIVFLLDLMRFNSLTALRLRNWRKQGWRFDKAAMRIIEIKGWRNRYYVVPFVRAKSPADPQEPPAEWEDVGKGERGHLWDWWPSKGKYPNTEPCYRITKLSKKEFELGKNTTPPYKAGNTVLGIYFTLEAAQEAAEKDYASAEPQTIKMFPGQEVVIEGPENTEPEEEEYENTDLFWSDCDKDGNPKGKRQRTHCYRTSGTVAGYSVDAPWLPYRIEHKPSNYEAHKYEPWVLTGAGKEQRFASLQDAQGAAQDHYDGKDEPEDEEYTIEHHPDEVGDQWKVTIKGEVLDWYATAADAVAAKDEALAAAQEEPEATPGFPTLTEEDLPPAESLMDEARKFRKLKDGGKTFYQLAEEHGLLQQEIRNRCKLLRLAPKEQQKVHEGKLTLEKGVKIVDKRDAGETVNGLDEAAVKALIEPAKEETPKEETWHWKKDFPWTDIQLEKFVFSLTHEQLTTVVNFGNRRLHVDFNDQGDVNHLSKDRLIELRRRIDLRLEQLGGDLTEAVRTIKMNVKIALLDEKTLTITDEDGEQVIIVNPKRNFLEVLHGPGGELTEALGWAVYESKEDDTMTRTWFQSLTDAKFFSERKPGWNMNKQNPWEWDDAEERWESKNGDSPTIYHEFAHGQKEGETEEYK